MRNKLQLRRIGGTLFALFMVLVGITTLWHGTYAWGAVAVPRWMGWADIAFGVSYGLFSLFASPKQVNWVDQASICPKCQIPYPPDWKGDAVCPKCGVPLESLNGFYDRHPELRDPAPQNAPKPRN